jgi:hypothetical protein
LGDFFTHLVTLAALQQKPFNRLFVIYVFVNWINYVDLHTHVNIPTYVCIWTIWLALFRWPSWR